MPFNRRGLLRRQDWRFEQTEGSVLCRYLSVTTTSIRLSGRSRKKMQREGVFREMKRRRFYEKPSEKTAREESEAIRRARKLARKRAHREGLIPAPRKKELEAGKAVGRRRAATYR